MESHDGIFGIPVDDPSFGDNAKAIDKYKYVAEIIIKPTNIIQGICFLFFKLDLNVVIVKKPSNANNIAGIDAIIPKPGCNPFIPLGIEGGFGVGPPLAAAIYANIGNKTIGMNLIIVKIHWIPSPTLNENQEKNNNHETIPIDISAGNQLSLNNVSPLITQETSSMDATT